MAQQKDSIPKSYNNSFGIELGGAGLLYSIAYERQTKQSGIFNLYAKGFLLYVPKKTNPIEQGYNDLGCGIELGLKIGKSNKKLVIGAGYAYNYFYSSGFNFTFPVADGSFRYRNAQAVTAKISYQHYFYHNKCRLEFGGLLYMPQKEHFDFHPYPSCGPTYLFEPDDHIPWFICAFAYSF